MGKEFNTVDTSTNLLGWYQMNDLDGVETDRAQSGKPRGKYIGWLEVGRYSDKNFYGFSVMSLLIIIIKLASFKDREASWFRWTYFQNLHLHSSHLILKHGSCRFCMCWSRMAVFPNM